jgi:hypothetical protein
MHAFWVTEDSLKDRMEDQRKGNYVITSEELEDIMEEAMHIMWEFIKADRVETTTTSGSRACRALTSSSRTPWIMISWRTSIPRYRR